MTGTLTQKRTYSLNTQSDKSTVLVAWTEQRGKNENEFQGFSMKKIDNFFYRNYHVLSVKTLVPKKTVLEFFLITQY